MHLRIALVFALLINIQSCFITEECPDALPYFEINNIGNEHYKYDGQSLNPWSEVGVNDSVSIDNYFLICEFDVNYISKKHSISSANNLFALSCTKNGEFGTKFGINSLDVISLNNYNSMFAQNDTINEIILIDDQFRINGNFKDFTSIESFINKYDDFLYTERIMFKLTKAPDSINQKFKLIISLDNGEVFTSITNPINLIQ